MAPCYVYVLWAVRDDFVKVGITRSLSRRANDHNGNSSNPLEFQRWKFYQFATRSDAGKIEAIVKRRLQDQGLSYRDKRELFQCAPTLVSRAIDQALIDLNVQCLKNFPADVDQALDTFCDFPSLPSYGLQILTDDQERLYWKGVSDAFACLSYFHGLTMNQNDLLKLYASAARKPATEVSTILIDYFRNHSASANNKEAIQTIAAACGKLRQTERYAFRDWQRLEDEDEAA